MQPHVHTDIWAFLFAGVSAIVLMNALRIGGAWLADNPRTEWLGKGIGALITFSGDTSEVSA